MGEEEKGEVFDQFEQTEQMSEQFSEYMGKVKREKHQLVQKIQELEEEEEISSTKAEEILTQVGRGNYGEARHILQEALEKQGLEFDAKEKNLFAEKFSGAFNDIEDAVDKIRDDLAVLSRDVDDEQLISYLYGKHSSWTKRELRALFNTMMQIRNIDVSVEDMARVLAAYNTDLTITTTKEMVRAIKKEAER